MCEYQRNILFLLFFKFNELLKNSKEIRKLKGENKEKMKCLNAKYHSDERAIGIQASEIRKWNKRIYE
jgi:hypothetical protein